MEPYILILIPFCSKLILHMDKNSEFLLNAILSKIVLPKRQVLAEYKLPLLFQPAYSRYGHVHGIWSLVGFKKFLTS